MVHGLIIQIICGVPQGSILGTLHFLIYVNDLYLTSNILEPIMFAGDTSLFYSDKNIKTLFNTVNLELNKLSEWFKIITKCRKNQLYFFFQKLSKRDSIPLKLPHLLINDTIIQRENSIKFLGVIIIDENLTWKNHITSIENKISKNIDVLYKSKFLLNKTC